MSVVNEVKEFYSNDIVYRFDKRKRITFGVVVDSYEGSTDSDEHHALQKGQIRVWWVNNSREQVWRQSKVRLMSRNIIPGDIVRRLEHGKETQRGYCKESKQFATVQIVGTDKIIEKVSSDRLTNVSPYDINAAVCLDKKYGRIQSFDQLVTMRSKCGSSVEVLSSINHDVEDYWLSKRNRGFFELFYPGQEIMCTPYYLEQPHWIVKSKTMKRNMQSRQRFTVQKVEPAAIEVAWHDCPSSDCTTFSEIKSIDIKKLKILEPLENCYLELAERRLLKLAASDIMTRKRDWIRKQSALHRSDSQKVLHVVNRNNKRPTKIRSSLLFPPTSVPSDEPDEDWWTEEVEEMSDNGSSCSNTSCPARTKCYYPPKPKDLAPGHTLAVEVLCMESRATIVWQDGTEEKDIPTTQLYYSISLDDHEFFPGEWVVMATEKEELSKYGAVQNVNYLERTAMVKWFTYLEAEQKPQLLCSHEISVYDLKKHSSMHSVQEGYVIVLWIDNVTENCWPQNIELLPETIDYDYSYDDNDDRSQALMAQVKERAKGWGVELRGRLFSIDNQCPSTTKAKAAEKENINKVVKLEHKINAQIESCREGGKEAGDIAEPSTPMTPDPDTILMPHDNLCVELLSMLKARMDLAYAEIISRIGGTQALSVMTKASETNVSPSTSTPVPSFPTTPDDSFTALSPPKFNQKAPTVCEKETGYSIMEEAPATHRFYSKEFEPTDKMRFFKAVHKECKLLRESLPPGVWVRSYSNRLDLLSVMIRGPNKTPYEDGLFLFDLQLSPDYPRSPPVCHYISYSSERLNPNLYVEGRVCVSLLGTWTGRGTEVWGPNSTLLQLIVSIQGLILVSEPYYNEAGYEKQTESQQGYENSRTYNELVILKLVQSMTAMLLSPPEIFKTEIYVHFLEKGMRMYERLKNWTSDSDCIKPEFPLLPVSKGLRLSLNTSLEQFQKALKQVSEQQINIKSD
ncbi:(e3-independent) e2 ubiquitin-conjugating enzyme [Holotrichia oblita]|uniref:(E3-independent) e2 ubiquitin-conjugating enzyme n=1 Tax=Holotrichia oblita TaxID=644536 RepID=A0ACB9SKS3_HOLOL|nr:(e3-independent) e2 ubiquitin-conjugating enzyme [Holotrichia oblita]